VTVVVVDQPVWEEVVAVQNELVEEVDYLEKVEVVVDLLLQVQVSWSYQDRHWVWVTSWLRHHQLQLVRQICCYWD